MSGFEGSKDAYQDSSNVPLNSLFDTSQTLNEDFFKDIFDIPLLTSQAAAWSSSAPDKAVNTATKPEKEAENVKNFPKDVMELGLPSLKDEHQQKALGAQRRNKRILEGFYRPNTGLNQNLSLFIVYDMYIRHRKHSPMLFTEPRPEMLWPVPPEELEEGFLLMERRGGPEESYGRVELEETEPLYLSTIRLIEEPFLSKPGFKRINLRLNPKINAYHPNLIDVNVKTISGTSPMVTLDHSLELHEVLKNLSKNIWDQEWEALAKRAPYQKVKGTPNPHPPVFDKYLPTVLAQRTQELLADLLDTIIDFQTRLNIDNARCLTMSTILNLFELTEIPEGAVERMKIKMKRLFPELYEHPFQIYVPKDKGKISTSKLTKQLLMKHYYRKYRRSRGEKGVPPSLITGPIKFNSIIDALNHLQTDKESAPKRTKPIIKEDIEKLKQWPPPIKFLSKFPRQLLCVDENYKDYRPEYLTRQEDANEKATIKDVPHIKGSILRKRLESTKYRKPPT